MPRLSSLVAEPDGGDSLHRAGDRARPCGPRGRTSSSWRSATARFPARRTPSRRASWRSRRTRPATARAWDCPSFRAAAARFVSAEFGYSVTAENIVVASGAKPFEQYFAEAVLDPGDGVLVFSPQFPTYVPNLERRGARAVLAPLEVEQRVPPFGRGRPAVSGHRSQAAGDLPELAAQSDRRRGHSRRPGRDRRRRARHRA